ncbi:hypothetical protein ACPCTO_26695 [Streptomyces olivoreticuli]
MSARGVPSTVNDQKVHPSTWSLPVTIRAADVDVFKGHWCGFLLCDRLGWGGTRPAVLGAAVVFALWMTAVRFDLRLPRLGRHEVEACRLCRVCTAPEPRTPEYFHNSVAKEVPAS